MEGSGWRVREQLGECREGGGEWRGVGGEGGREE